MATHVKTYCRFCHAYCPMVATVENNKVLAVEPDTDNPLYGGYTCIKGRQMAEQMYHPTRITVSQKKQANGEFADISSSQALDEIAAKLSAIAAQHGPGSIASYNGTYSYQNSAAHAVARAWHGAVGSNAFYTSVTIDQPAKVGIGPARMGWWNGGNHTWGDANVALLIGNNTLVSHFSAPGGIPSFSPHSALREGKQRGMKIICVDPRRTEAAARADIHLQVKPGQDAVLLAGLVHIILTEKLQDHEFCAEHTRGLEELTQAVAPFTPAMVSAAADVPQQLLIDAARMFAAGPRGSAVSGTGPEMGPHPNLVQHLVQTLNAICGRHYRAGERLPNPGVLTLALPRQAQATGPQPQWLKGPRSRVSDKFGEIMVLGPTGPLPEMPCAVISDEILMEGEGQIKALLCIGGNPLLAWPDQQKSYRALQALDLLVCIDIKHSATAKLADYILAPKVCLEREDVTLLTDMWYEQPYSQYTRAVVEPEQDLIEEWEFFWELGKRMNLQLKINGQPVDMVHKPAKIDLLKLITAGSRVPVEEIRKHTGGNIYTDQTVIVAPADPATAQRLDLFPALLDQELAAAWRDGQPESQAGRRPFRLISRRMKNTYNSTGPELEFLGEMSRTNPAFIHPSDLTRLAISDGDVITISSNHGEIPAIARASTDIKPGAISMSHCWGAAPAGDVDSKVADIGANTNRLVNNLEFSEMYSGMTHQSALAVSIHKATSP